MLFRSFYQCAALSHPVSRLLESDFVRLRASLAPPHWKRSTPSDSDKWDAGYERTAFFLDWIEVRVAQQPYVNVVRSPMRDLLTRLPHVLIPPSLTSVCARRLYSKRSAPALSERSTRGCAIPSMTTGGCGGKLLDEALRTSGRVTRPPTASISMFSFDLASCWLVI